MITHVQTEGICSIGSCAGRQRHPSHTDRVGRLTTTTMIQLVWVQVRERDVAQMSQNEELTDPPYWTYINKENKGNKYRCVCLKTAPKWLITFCLITFTVNNSSCCFWKEKILLLEQPHISNPHVPPVRTMTYPLYFHWNPLSVTWLTVLGKSATLSPITQNECGVYESDYRPISPEIRALSPRRTRPHRTSQAWPQMRVLFTPLLLLIAVKRRLNVSKRLRTSWYSLYLANARAVWVQSSDTEKTKNDTVEN